MTEYECVICRDVYSTPTEKRQHRYETHNEKLGKPCQICYRIISDDAEDVWDIVRFYLHRMSSPDRHTFERSGLLCGPCADEFLELVNEMPSIDHYSDLGPGDKEWWEFTKCNLCGDSLKRTRGGLQHSWGGPVFDNWEFHVLCDSCVDVVMTFIKNLPEEIREGDYFYGRKEVEVGTSVEEADFGTIEEAFQEIEIGDEVHVEIHLPATENRPRDYTKFDGTVVDRRSPNKLTAVCINPHSEPGEYRIVRTSQYSYSIDAHHIAMDGNGKGQLGEVTVLEIIS